MRTESNPTGRVRAVGLSLLLVVSIIGGATAVVGGTDTDGSLTDDVDDTLTPTPDGDTLQLDDGESSDGDTSDDGGSGDSTTDTDDTEESTTTDTDDSGSGDDTLAGDDTADATEDVTSSDAGSTAAETGDTATDAATATTGAVTDGDALESTLRSLPTGRLDTRIVGLDVTSLLSGPSLTTQQRASTTSDDAESSGAGTAHDSVGITAGATNQSAFASTGADPATFAVTESEAGNFPANGTARFSLPSGSGVRFDTGNSSAVASADNANVTLTNVTATTVTLDVASTDRNATSTLRVSGLRFESTGDATATEATWTFGTTAASTTVEPERLDVTGFDDDVPRGAHGAPNGGTRVFAEAPDDARTTGFVGEGNYYAIKIPMHLREDVDFDTSASLTVRTDGGDCDLPVVGDHVGAQQQEEYFLTDHQILVQLSCDIGREAYLEVGGVRFNVTGTDVGTPAEIRGQLFARYEPVDAVDQVDVDAGEVRAHAPIVSTTGTTVSANATNVTGDGNVTVSIADDTGNQLGDGSRIVVELQDTGVTFNDTQSFEAVTVAGDASAPTVVSADASTVVLEVNGTTDAGDEFRLQRTGGGAIRFDVAANASDTAFRVTTSPGAEDVTQATGPIVEVRSECASIMGAVDENGDGRIGDFELLEAADLWRDQEPVPGTCGKTIDDFDLLEISETWRNDQNAEGDS